MTTKLTLCTAVAMLALSGAAGRAQAEGSPDLDRGMAPIQGPWQVTITPVDCDTGEAYSDFAFQSYLTFGAGGALAETTASLSFQPNQRSPGHGYWRYTGSQTYRAYFQAFVRFDSVDPQPPARPYLKGVQSVDQSIEMTDRNHWTSDVLVGFRDVSGTMVPPSGCAKAAAERMR